VTQATLASSPSGRLVTGSDTSPPDAPAVELRLTTERRFDNNPQPMLDEYIAWALLAEATAVRSRSGRHADEQARAAAKAMNCLVTGEPVESLPDTLELRVLRRPWFPAELQIQRADALVWAPAAFRKHGVYLSARDLEAA
jgi:hypothetical protein